jgi:imidazolonepropionase-like amidohydrolase
MGSAEALNMSHKIGTVEVGKEADLLVVRKDPTKSTDVLYNEENIYLTFIKGRLTVEDGRFVW